MKPTSKKQTNENALSVVNSTVEPHRSNEIIIYQPDSTMKLDVLIQDEMVWLTQQQIAELFGVKQPAISKHLRNIFVGGELEENSVHSILEYTAADGKIYQTGKKLFRFAAPFIRESFISAVLMISLRLILASA